MKIKLLNQTIQRGKEHTNKYERRRNLDKDLWITSYITNISIDVSTDEAEQLIETFISTFFFEYDVYDITLERNGMYRFWQFTMVTGQEIIDFEISE